MHLSAANFSIYLLKILASDWSDLMLKCSDTKISFVNGGMDPAVDVATIAEYREAYPWISIEVIPDAGQLMIFQHYDRLIPRIAEAAKRVCATEFKYRGKR